MYHDVFTSKLTFSKHSSFWKLDNIGKIWHICHLCDELHFSIKLLTSKLESLMFFQKWLSYLRHFCIVGYLQKGQLAK